MNVQNFDLVVLISKSVLDVFCIELVVLWCNTTEFELYCTIFVSGNLRGWFLKQIEIDTAFLESIGVLDYSLLAGVQPLHDDEKKRNTSLDSIVTRASRYPVLLPHYLTFTAPLG